MCRRFIYRSNVALSLKAAQALAIEYKATQEEFKLLKSRKNKSRSGWRKLKVNPAARDAPTLNELQDFDQRSTVLFEQLEKKIAAIGNEQVRGILSVESNEFRGLRKKERRNKVPQKKLPLGGKSFAFQVLLSQAELELENDGFLALTDSEGKRNITAKVFTRHAKHKGGIFLQARDGLTKFYPYDKFDRASRSKFSKAIYVHKHLVVYRRGHEVGQQ